jgi:hypothetical protein
MWAKLPGPGAGREQVTKDPDKAGWEDIVVNERGDAHFDGAGFDLTARRGFPPSDMSRPCSTR